MSLAEIVETGGVYSSIGIILFICLSFIKIPKKEINLWNLIGRSMNKDLLKKISDVDEKVGNIESRLDVHVAAQEKENAERARKRILRFSDECLKGEKHTKEHFEDILSDIDKYETYCSAHPDYPNNKALLAIDSVKKRYKKCLESGEFLE